MKRDDGKGIDRPVVLGAAFRAGVRFTILQGCLSLFGSWLISAHAQPTYTQLTLDNPMPQAFASFGSAVAGVGDVNGDDTPDLLVGAPDQTVSGNVAQGQAFVLSGKGGNLLFTLDNPIPQTAARFGSAVAGVGDVNGDGIPDLLVGAPGQSGPGGIFSKGLAFLFSGVDGQLLFTLDDPAPDTESHFGDALAGVEDINGDSVPDLIVAAPGRYIGGLDFVGRVFAFSGADGRLLLTLNDPVPQEGAIFGRSVDEAGDINGDGTPDLLVGAPGQEVTDIFSQGQAFVYSGVGGRLLLTLDTPTPARFANFGSSVARLGDVDRDGVPDLAVGAGGQDQAYVFSGADGRVLFTVPSGSIVAGLGDVNGDNVPDLAVGNGFENRIVVYSGTEGDQLFTLVNPTPQEGAGFGSAIARVDSRHDDAAFGLLVGAPGQDVDGDEDQGRAFLFVGKPPAPVCLGAPATIVGTPGNDVFRGTPGNDVIGGLAGHDVIDGRGGNDLICGGPGNDVIHAGAGNDRVSGGGGNDVLNVVDGVRGNDAVDGGPHVDGDVCAADRGDTVRNCNP
jgi:Ca2+-binding RTX toxin-like protein